MRKILTNLDKLVHLALTDDSDRTIAVIKVESGEQDITAKVLRAIDDDLCAESVDLLYGTTTDPENLLKEIPVTTDLLIEQPQLSDSNSFEVEILDEAEDDETYTSTYYLETIEIY